MATLIEEIANCVDACVYLEAQERYSSLHSSPWYSLDYWERRLPRDAGLRSCIDRWCGGSDRVVIYVRFRHCEGWTEHKLVITPSFGGLNIYVDGSDLNNVKNYLIELFSEVLRLPAY